MEGKPKYKIPSNPAAVSISTILASIAFVGQCGIREAFPVSEETEVNVRHSAFGDRGDEPTGETTMGFLTVGVLPHTTVSKLDFRESD